jgi:hypothetical protein
MAAKRGISNLNASINSNKAAKEVPISKRPKGSPGKKTKQQEAPPVSQAAPHTLSDFLLLQETPASGSEPSSSAVTLPPSVVHGAQTAQETAADTTPTVVHGAQPAPETAADTNVGIISAEDGRRQSARIANATAKTGGGNATQESSDILQDEDDDEDENADDVPDDEDEIRSNTTGQGRTPTKPFAVAEKRGRGRPYKSPSQQGLCATLHRPYPNPNTFYP